MTDLNEVLGQDGVATMIRSWMAWSATNIMFGPDGKLLLGVRSNAEPRAIPEAGDVALVGGFNTVIDGPAMFRDVADAHAKVQLGIVLTPEQCTGFLPCEYEMADMDGPLKTPQGVLNIKRVAFDRIVVLTEEQVAAIVPTGKLRDVVWATREEFEAMVEAGTLSSRIRSSMCSTHSILSSTTIWTT